MYQRIALVCLLFGTAAIHASFSDEEQECVLRLEQLCPEEKVNSEFLRIGERINCISTNFETLGAFCAQRSLHQSIQELNDQEECKKE